ncbi:MAG: phosphoglycolate phosphatase, partial [Gammaproteobacteria bacterium]
MRLYLFQHAEALPEEVDPARPLSEAGRRQAAALGRLLAASGVRPSAWRHSGKERARQTAA